MEALGWEACDIILVTGDAYVDHPSFGMGIIGRLLEAQGFRVGILDQPDWNDPHAFHALGEPTLFFGVTGGNMDSLVNHYTSDKKPRSDDAYTPGGLAGSRPDRATIVYTHRCRAAFPDRPVIIGGIEASLRRLAHFDYWSNKVRRSLLVDSGADLLIYGNAERALVEIAHRIAAGENPRKIYDVRGTAVRRQVGASGPIDAELGEFLVERSDQFDAVGVIDPLLDPYATEEEMRSNNDLIKEESSSGSAQNLIQLGLKKTEVAQQDQSLNERKIRASHPRERTIIRLPSSADVTKDKALYAHANRVFHLEANPHNARALVQRNGDTDVFVNPPPFPLTTAEMDKLYELPYQRVPHPAHQDKIPAYEMIRFSVTIMRGCFGGCSFCSITEHEGRIIQSRSEKSILNEVEGLKQIPGFTGAVSDLGGPTANMYRLACKSRAIEASCRKPSCVYPGICSNLNTDHSPLIQIYKKARRIPGIKKIAIASGLRYDLAVESPEYIKELVTHHVGGYLKIAPEHTESGPLSKMMKPGIGAYDRFKELFEEYSKKAGKKQYLIPYFIAAHPGTRDEDMLELALWLKANGYRADQVQAFLPSPMSYATAMYHTGRNPLKAVKAKGSEPVYSVKTYDQRKLHKAFLRYHDSSNWPLLRKALRKMGRSDLIGNQPTQLIPGESRATRERAGRQHHRGRHQAQPSRSQGRAGKRRSGSTQSGRFATTHNGLPQFPPKNGRKRP
ncbi:MAG: YgiQ family radical SAM protein [Polyangiaceae bacterium]|nr:YgiQ family radical SAM protein [Polyangiaceae bacterium]